MIKVEAERPQENLQDRLAQVVGLSHRHKVVEDLAHHQEGQHYDRAENLIHQRNLVELRRRLEELYPADIAHILESLPLDGRLTVWQLVKPRDDGNIPLRVSDAVRKTLIADMNDHEIIAATKDLDIDELVDLAPELPRNAVHEPIESLDTQQHGRVHSALLYGKGQIGALMDFEMITIHEDISLEVVLRYLCRLKELPGHTDKLFVVDYDGMLKSVLPIKRLPVNDSDKQVLKVMATDPVTFHPNEDGYDTAQVFERYDLTSTPAMDKGGKLIGRLTIDEMVDPIYEESESEVLSMAGLREEEDIFASVWESTRNRWVWLAINLTIAFVASRVVSLSEGPIEKLATLAALMPIVVGIDGNSGNQTITMIVRAIALDQVQLTSNSRNCLLYKELGVALVNGLAWDGVIGVMAFYLYGNWELGVVTTTAMTLNLLPTAMMGVLIPVTLHRFGRDPAMDSSMIITAITDSGGFFIFLGLATIFLM